MRYPTGPHRKSARAWRCRCRNIQLSTEAWRAAIQLTLPRSVLISPLWATMRYGCASFHDGKVLVEKRADARARPRSRKRGCLQVLVIGADLVGEEHALVDNRPRRHGSERRSRSPCRRSPGEMRFEITLRKHKEPAFEILVCFNVGIAPDEAPAGATGSVAAICGAFDSDELSTGTSRKPISD